MKKYTNGALLAIVQFMKYTSLILLVIAVSAQLLLAKVSAGQSLKEVKIDLELKNKTLQQALNSIEKISGFKFVYYNESLAPYTNINIVAKKKPVASILNSILSKTNLDYLEQNSKVIIVEKEATKDLIPKIIPQTRFNKADDITVKGKVSDIQGTLVGAGVALKSDPKISTTTNAAGEYTIRAPANGTLIFSMLGYKPQEVEIRGEGTLNVTLESEVSALNAVTVVAFGTQKKESVVGSISTVEVEDLKIPTRTITQALAGRVAGVIAVQRSGEPGADDAQFWIRGISTFGAGANPLILVDGVERPISNIEPEEIQSFSILKDAGATAVYGIRGANGVVLVTTRKGANQKPQISLKMESGMHSATDLPEYVGGVDYMNLVNEANIATGLAAPYSASFIANTASKADPELYPDLDWLDFLMEKYAYNKRANINISGGGQAARYFVSATYYDEGGNWKGQQLSSYNTTLKLKRYNFRGNIDLDLSQNTGISLNFSSILTNKNDAGNNSNAIWNDLIVINPIYSAPSFINPQTGLLVYGGEGNSAGTRNPYASLVNSGFVTSFNNGITADITLKHDLQRWVPGLKIQGKFAYDTQNSHNINRTRSLGDRYRATGRDANGDLILVRTNDGPETLAFSTSSSGNRRFYLESQATYNKTIGDHSISGLLLYSQQDFIDAAQGSSINALPFRYQGYVGRVSYNYKSRYFLEVNAGYNGSENFEKGKRFGLFPSVAAGWIVSEEPFFKKGDIMQYLKLRGSYGIKGNDKIGGNRRFAYITTTGTGGGTYQFGNTFANSVGGIGEADYGSDLTWEEEREVNLGIETRFLKGFYLQADVFHRSRTGILLQRAALPQSMGLRSAPWGNLGAMKNKGVDGTLEYKKRLGQVSLTARGNFTYARNEIIENDQAVSASAPWQDLRGQRNNQPLLLTAIGLYEESDFVSPGVLKADIPLPGFGGVRPGDIRYKDIDGNGRVNLDDREFIGDPANPDIVYGFGGSLDFKGIDFSFLFQGTAKTDFTLSGNSFYAFREGNKGQISTIVRDSRWTPENPSQNVVFPRLFFGDNGNNYQASTWWQRDADFIRLKTMEVGYSFPKTLIQKVRMNNLRVYVNGNNLLTFSKFKYWDPELGSGNGASYPIQRVFNLGINSSF